MEMKPRIVWRKWIQMWVCFIKEGDRLEKIGFGKTFQKAYDDWRTKNEQ